MLSFLTRCASHVGEITLGVSLIILILWLLDRYLDTRYTARWRCWVWMILALRLLIPWNFSLPQAPVQLHLPTTQQEQTTVLTDTPINQTTDKEATIPTTIPPTMEEVAQMPPIPQASAPSLTLAQIAALVWLAGVLLFLVWHMVAAWHFWRGLRPWCHAVDANTLSLYEQLCQELHLFPVPQLMQCRKLHTPMAMGLLRPTILLPREKLPSQQLEMVLRHELTHIRRHDLWYQLLILVARAMHWFNPLVHLMGHLAQRDIELSCDAQVVAGRDNAYRRCYGGTILSTAAHTNDSPTLSTEFTGGKHMLQHRLSHLFDHQQRKHGIITLVLLTALAIAIGTLVACGPSSQTDEGERYVNEDLGFALTFPATWQSEEAGINKYMVTEEDGQVIVTQLYPYETTDSALSMGPILFTIQRLDGGLLVPDDVAMGPPTQILAQSESYTYVAVFPGDVQSPRPEETEAYETYQLLSSQVDEVLDTLEILHPIQSENGYKLVGPGLFTMHIPDDWQLVDDKIPFTWHLLKDDTQLATITQDVWEPSWQGKGIEQTEYGLRIWDGDLQRAFLLNWKGNIPAEQCSQVENSIQLRGMQYNIYDLQSLALQYLAYNTDSQQLFGRIVSIDTHKENESLHYDGMTIALYKWVDTPDGPYAKDLEQTMYLPSAVEASPIIAPLDEQSQLMPYSFQWTSPTDLAQNGDYQNDFYDFTTIHGNLYLAIGHYVA